MALTFLFGNLYFGLLLWSDYTTQHFRISEESRVGSAFARKAAREYLHAIRKDHVELSGEPVKDSQLKDGTSLEWSLQLVFMAEFDGPTPESSMEADPVALDEFAYALAAEQERIYRYFDGDTLGKLSHSGDLIGHAVAGALDGSIGGPNDHSNLYNHGVVLFCDMITAALEGGEKGEIRQLYVGAVLFSSLGFMTAGYGDFVPNSQVALGLMGFQFLVYLAVFILFLPVSWSAGNPGGFQGGVDVDTALPPGS